MIEILDNFFEDYAGVLEHVQSLSYKGEVNPVDGVMYPYINTNIPSPREVFKYTKGGFSFLRLSPEGVKAPHQVHTDSVMGKRTLLIYLCEGEGGTSLVKHRETGAFSNPETPEEQALWERDHNSYDAWDIYRYFEIKPNRAVSFPSNLFHRAEPIEGFGNNAENGRLVLTCFYD